jgi:hypothetical protein
MVKADCLDEASTVAFGKSEVRGKADRIKVLSKTKEVDMAWMREVGRSEACTMVALKSCSLCYLRMKKRVGFIHSLCVGIESVSSWFVMIGTANS